MTPCLISSPPDRPELTTGVINWHVGRCGSSVLGSLLGRHPLIQSENEIFSRFMPRRRGEAQLPAMEDVFAAAETKRKLDFQIVEIKYLKAQNLGLYTGAELEDWLDNALRHGFSMHMLMHRRNSLRRIISHLMAQHTGIYVLKDGHEAVQKVASKPINIDFENIKEGFEQLSLLEWLEMYEQSFCAMRDQLTDWCSRNGAAAPLILSYDEDIKNSPLAGYNKVCNYLGIEPIQTTIDLRQINNKPLTELILNLESVSAILRPTRFAWMLDD